MTLTSGKSKQYAYFTQKDFRRDNCKTIPSNIEFFDISKQLMSRKAVMLQNQADGAAAPADSEAAVVAHAKKLLSSCSYIALRGITCEVKEGILVLTGCVPSYFLKQVAQTRVDKSTLPRVNNQIEVVLPCTVQSDA